ncbi:MAG: signal transduction histidine kinase, LytS [Paenibacillaceae bacterium]|jgi:two-component system sensor histidine kinase YesM|nr:signal transduction histidine kinase, LytS [Paenibacillaceae bacterium]
MWYKLRNISIRKQLAGFFCMVIVMGSSGQVYYSLAFYHMQRQENTSSSYAVISRTDAMLSQTAGELANAAGKIANDQNVQSLLKLQNNAVPDNLTERSILGDIIVNYFGGIVESNGVIEDMAVISQSQMITTYSRIFNYATFSQLNSDYSGEIPWDRLIPAADSRQAQGNPRGFAYVSPIYDRSSIYESNRLLGLCIIWSNSNVFANIVNETAVSQNSTVLLADAHGIILAQRSGLAAQDFSDFIAQLAAEYGKSGPEGEIRNVGYKGVQYYVLIQMNSATGWKSVNITPVKEIYEESRRLLLVGLGLAGAIIIITLVLGMYMIWGITNPLMQIVLTLRRIGRGDRKLRLSSDVNNEFSVISKRANDLLDHINSASDRILHMQAKLYESEYMRKDSEMRMLQNQINPHFLYNTFECIRSIGMVKGIREISVISTSIANIFRYSTKGGAFTTVEEELKCVSDYCKVIGIRFAGRLALSVIVEPELYDCRMPKLSLQPLVENAVNHGLEKNGAVLQLEIRGRQENGTVLFAVSDNGVGMGMDQMEALNRELAENAHYDMDDQRKSIGLKNINLRLKLYYGDKYGLQVCRGEGEGTTVIMRLKYGQMT